MTVNKYYKDRPYLRAVFFFGLMLLLNACGTTRPLKLSDAQSLSPAPESFRLCHGYGCWVKSQVSLTNEEWENATASLKTRADSAEKEREQISATIGKLEQISGVKTGTDKDLAKATMAGHSPYQLDCIDEALNSTTYLSMIENAGLFHYHKVSSPARRGIFIDGAWPHNTASITDIQTGKSYAVDSWYRDNGEPAYIIPLEEWLSGWKPDDKNTP